MGHPGVLALAVVAPIAGSVVTILLARFSGRVALVAAVASLALATTVLAVQVPAVFGHGRIVTEHLGGFGPFDGHQLGVTFFADGFGLAVALAVAGVGTVLVMYALSELHDLGDHELGWLAALALLVCAGAIGAALTGDLLNLFVWFEVSALASYGLTGFWLERPVALEAAFKIAILTALAGFLVFVGVGILYQAHGAVNFGELHAAMRSSSSRADLVAVALLLAGFATKAGLVPFHTWLPDAHSAAPGPVSALFSGLLILVGVVGVARVAFVVIDVHAIHLLGLLTVLGVISGLLGALAALGQDDLKRLLAYDTVSQSGVILIGLATASVPGVSAGVLHLVNHAVFKSLLFLTASAVVHITGTEKLSELGGLARRVPVLAAMFVIGIAALIGVPPLNGQISSDLLHDELRRHAPMLWLAVVVVEVLTVAALARAAWLTFFSPGREAQRRQQPNVGMVVSLAVLAAVCVLTGAVGQRWWTRAAATAAGGLLASDHTASAALAATEPLPRPLLEVHLTNPIELSTTFGVIVLGVALAYLVVRRGAPAPVRWVQALHTGWIHDDVAALVAGLLLVLIGSIVTR